MFIKTNNKMTIKTKKTTENSFFLNERIELLPVIANEIIRETPVKFNVESISSVTKYDESGNHTTTTEDMSLLGIMNTTNDKRFLVSIYYEISENGDHKISGSFLTMNNDGRLASEKFQKGLNNPKSLINYLNQQFN
jgi:hypothetical protein